MPNFIKLPLNIFLVMIVVSTLSACSKTFPVTGNIPRSGEKFLGTATSVMVGKSSIRMTTDTGTKCEGQYIAPVAMEPTEGGMGEGTFQCDDGRSGTFTFTGNTISGEGFGNMNNGDKFDFTYGHTRIVKIR